MRPYATDSHCLNDLLPMKRMHAQDRGHHDYILPLGLKGSNDVLSIDASVILFRFPIYILYFGI